MQSCKHIVSPNHNFLRLAKDVNEICQPLFLSSPITYFATVRVYPNQKYSGCVSDRRWAQHYLNFGYDNCLVEPYQAFYTSDPYILWSTSKMFTVDNNAKDLYKDCVEFGYTNGITITERYEEYVDLFYFVAGKDNEKLDDFFLRNMNYLKSFILCFKEKINRSHKFDNLYTSLYTAERNESKSLIECSGTARPMLGELHPSRYYIGPHGQYLTKKELNLLKNYMRSSGVKECAKEMGISQRTIETHMFNIRLKFNCNKVHQVYKLLVDSGYADICDNLIG